MTKIEEIEYNIKVHENAIMLSTDRLVSLRAELAELAELAEAEKPKLRHGDFGISHKPFVVVSQPKTIEGSPKAIYADGSGQVNADEVMSPDLRLGNIFDLLKEWSEDLEDSESIDVEYLKRQIIIEDSHRYPDKTFITVRKSDGFRAEGAHLSLAELDNLWRKLGQKIAEVKRKAKK